MTQYLKYFLRGFITMLGAVVAVVVVYFLVQSLLLKGETKMPNLPYTPETQESSQTEVVSEETTSATTDLTPGGIYLRDLPLTEAQVDMAETFGINVDTYYISPETIGCAENALGADRYQAIVGGESPSFTEATKLLKCL